MRGDRSHCRRWLVGAALALTTSSACSGPRGAQVRVIVPLHSNLRVAAESLARVGLVGSPRLFRMYALFRHGDRTIKAGTYLLRRGTGWNDILEALRAGRGIVVTITIPEGFSLTQIVPLLAAKLALPPDSVWAATRDTALLHRLDIPSGTLEGYLFPDTYTLPPGTPARAAVAAMVRRFEQRWKSAWTARLDSIPLSRNDVMALASLVEKEARLPEERPVIAAVYLNRLRDGMLLQADPTVQYALGEHQQRIYYKNLGVESPYNTYRHKGLPPGPVASPGERSIEAALYPANVPFKFFVAFPDGHHEFRVDFSGHTRAKRAAQRAWRSLAPPGQGADDASSARRKPATRRE